MAVQTKAIKQRIKSVKNTKKITKAMELVSASKMKRAVTKTLDARPYAKYSWDILSSLETSGREHALFKAREGSNILVVFITSNRGLCGGYNAQITRAMIAMMREHPELRFDFITVGKKGDLALRRLGKHVLATFEVGEIPTVAEILPVGEMVMNEFESGSYAKVLVAFTDYVSALTQTPTIKQLLPFSTEVPREGAEHESTEYVFEPGYDAIMDVLIDKISRMQVYQFLLESSASEQSARMMAMKNASDAAGEMIDDLTLMFNKARQAGITQEISEISAGMASVS